jgi:hypothetical protein
VGAPVDIEGLKALLKEAPIDGFDHVSVGAQGVGAIDVLGEVGGGHNDDGKEAEGSGSFVAEPFQEIKAGEARHLEVEENNLGQREFAAVKVGSLTEEVGDGVVAVFDDLEKPVNQS